MDYGLLVEISPLLEWKKLYAMVFLWDAINKCGRYLVFERQRLPITFLNRVLCLKGRDYVG